MVGRDEEADSVLAETTAATVARLRVPGAQVAVRRGGDLLWSGCVGRLGPDHADRADRAERAHRPDRADPGHHVVRREDRFVVASVTKLVVACAVLSLAEAGQLDLDTPVAPWLPELPHADRITARMLLRHRSGLPEYFRDPGVRRRLGAEPLAAWGRGELLEAVARLGSEAAPDERFAYRNTNYVALGELLVRRTGRTVGALVHDRVATPLRLTTLSFAGREHPVGRLASPHRRRLGRAVDLSSRTGGDLPTHAIGEVWTDGGIAASAEDLAALTEALFEGRLLRPETVDDMVRRSASTGNPVGGLPGALLSLAQGRPHRAYGLGVAVAERAGTTTLGHEGMYYGWSATTTFDSATRTTVAVTTNLAAIPVPAERLERAVRATLLSGPQRGRGRGEP